MDDLAKFTEFLFGDDVGFVYSPIKQKDRSWDSYWFKWPEQRQNLHDYIKTMNDSGDVYLSPCIYTEKKAKKEYVKSTRTVWVEFDGQTQIDFKGLPDPSTIVQTSTATHQHCYWKLGESISPTVAEEISKRLTYFFEADSSGWDITQVLRPPGTKNWKSQLKPLTTKLTRFTSDTFNTSAFDSAPTVNIPEVNDFGYMDLMEEKELRKILSEDLQERVFNQKANDKGRSHLLFSIAHELAETGFEHQQILSCIYIVDCRIKKFVGREDQLHRLSQISSIALFKVGRENHIESYSPLEIANHEMSLDFILGTWLHSKGMLFLAGAPGVGKTQLSFDMMYRLSTGEVFVGVEVTRPVVCYYFSLEMDILELKYIFEKQAQDYESHDVWNNTAKVFYFDEPNFIQFERLIKEGKPSVVFIDSLSEIVTEDMQESEARKILRWFKKMRRKYDVSFVIIHHLRKENELKPRRPTLSDMYGSFQFAAKSETVLALYDPRSTFLELIALKTRFDKKGIIRVGRTDNLTFVSKEVTSVTIEGDNAIVDAVISFGD